MTRNTILVAGSTAIDHTGFYPGDFRKYQSNYPIEALNISLQLTDFKLSFGGCAPNIAWGLTQLAVKAIPLSSAGKSFRSQYERHLQENNIDTQYIEIDDNTENCATCLMINDNSGNQIIGFYPGPDSMIRKLPSEITEVKDLGLAILGPELPSLTLAQARDLKHLDVPIIFDPGQVVANYKQPDIHEMLDLADCLIINEHEFKILQVNSRLSIKEICSRVDEVVVTHGADDVEIMHKNKRIMISTIKDIAILDVAGCGDAFRAGYAYGVFNNMSLESRGEIGCIMAMLNLKTLHTQSYRTNIDEILLLKAKHYV